VDVIIKTARVVEYVDQRTL